MIIRSLDAEDVHFREARAGDGQLASARTISAAGAARMAIANKAQHEHVAPTASRS
jgi:hypothetical protein